MPSVATRPLHGGNLQSGTRSEGYRAALQHGPLTLTPGLVSNEFIEGFRVGVHALTRAIPPSVHQMMHLLFNHAYWRVCASIRMVTPPLDRFARHAVAVLMRPVGHAVAIGPLGPKRHKVRPLALKYDAPLAEASSPSPLQSQRHFEERSAQTGQWSTRGTKTQLGA